jgi:hypothetical protein
LRPDKEELESSDSLAIKINRTRKKTEILRYSILTLVNTLLNFAKIQRAPR